jgi:hypothetical protein
MLLSSVQAKDADEQASGDYRTWTDISGNFTVEAAMLKFKGGKVHLRKEDGKVIQVTIGKLSKDDQRYVRDELARRKKSQQAQSERGDRRVAASAGGAFPYPYVEVDYSQVQVPRQLALLAKKSAGVDPRYAMFVLDLAGKYHVWAIADKSTPQAPFYDLLYFDLDGDGDPTEVGECFVGKHDPDGAAAGVEMTIRIPFIQVPGTMLVHRDFMLSTSPKSDRTGFWFRIQWNGVQRMSGGYGLTGLDTTTWSKSPEEAPIFRPCPLGPLSFATWGTSRDIILPAGGARKLNVIVGNAGSGPNTLSVVDEHFLDLERDELLVTVIATDAQGQTLSETSRIREHC